MRQCDSVTVGSVYPSPEPRAPSPGSSLVEPAHRHPARERPEREQPRRPLPADHRRHARQGVDGHHRQQEAHRRLQRQRGADGVGGGALADQRRELRRVGDHGEAPHRDQQRTATRAGVRRPAAVASAARARERQGQAGHAGLAQGVGQAPGQRCSRRRRWRWPRTPRGRRRARRRRRPPPPGWRRRRPPPTPTSRTAPTCARDSRRSPAARRAPRTRAAPRARRSGEVAGSSGPSRTTATASSPPSSASAEVKTIGVRHADPKSVVTRCGIALPSVSAPISVPRAKPRRVRNQPAATFIAGG